MTTQHSFYLAELFVNPAELSIHTPAGQVVSLQQKPMDVLVFLAQQYPALVSRQQLIDNVWGGNVYVGEKALTNAIWQLRNVLQQLAQMDLICTVRKKGYRLAVAPVMSDVSDGTSQDNRPQYNKTAMPTGRRPLYLLAVVVLLACFALLHYYPTAPVATEVTVLTKGNGRAMFPSLSADERYLVFSWRKFEAASDLYSLDLTEPDKPARQLTFTADDESRPLWAKDGRHVYYSSKTAVYGECNIMQLDTVTLHSQKLANCNRHSTGYMDITPDGRYLAFSGSMNAEGSSLYQLDLQNPEAQPQAIPCTENCQYLIRDLAFSPDGRYLAVTRRAHRLSEDIYLHNLASGEERKLTHGEEDILGLSWHPDSQRLLFGALHHGKRQGFVLDIAEGNKAASLQLDNFAWPSRVARNGEVYFHNSKSVPQLAYLPLNSTVSAAVFPLTANEARYEAPDYSKARHALAYVSNESGYMEIWQADAEMENRRQLTQLHGMVKYPQWSNSGRYIAFVGRLPTEEEDKLMLLEVQTGKLTQLKTGVRWHGRLSWWFDDSAVIFAYDGNLFSVDIATNAVEQLTLKGGSWGQMPTAEQFYFSKGRNRGLWQLLPDGTETQLLPGSVFSSRTAWAVAEQGIYFLQQKPAQLLVSHYDTETGQVEDLILLPPDLLHLQSIMSYDAKQQRLIFELSGHPSADLQRLQHPLLQ